MLWLTFLEFMLYFIHILGTEMSHHMFNFTMKKFTFLKDKDKIKDKQTNSITPPQAEPGQEQ